jgi:hypothetical protein
MEELLKRFQANADLETSPTPPSPAPSRNPSGP